MCSANDTLYLLLIGLLIEAYSLKDGEVAYSILYALIVAPLSGAVSS